MSELSAGAADEDALRILSGEERKNSGGREKYTIVFVALQNWMNSYEKHMIYLTRICWQGSITYRTVAVHQNVWT